MYIANIREQTDMCISSSISCDSTVVGSVDENGVTVTSSMWKSKRVEQSKSGEAGRHYILFRMIKLTNAKSPRILCCTTSICDARAVLSIVSDQLTINHFSFKCITSAKK